MGFVETGINWWKLASKDRLQERTSGWFNEIHINNAFNIHHKSKQIKQRGGVSLWNVDEAAHRLNKSGRDPSGMGRWTWSTYQGKNNKILRIIVLYRPCYVTNSKANFNPTEATGVCVNNTYAQQKKFLIAHNDTRCPRIALLEDLELELEQWISADEEIIMMGDFNEDVRLTTLTDRFLKYNGMREIILETHDHRQAPPTHQRGSKPIDGIWATSGISPTSCGYCEFGKGFPGDHRLLWIDIDYISAFGCLSPPLNRPKARKVSMKNPRSVKKFQKHYLQFINKHKLPQKAYALQQNIESPPSLEHTNEFETIDLLRLEGILFADKKCRKLHMGTVPFSPQYKRLMDEISLYHYAIKRRLKCHTNLQRLCRLEHKCNVSRPMASYTLNQLKDLLSSAYEKRKTFLRNKDNARNARILFIDELAAIQAENGKTTEEARLKSMQYIEKQRLSSRRIKFMEGATGGCGVRSIITKDEHGQDLELTDQATTEKALLGSNEVKFTQCSNHEFFTTELYKDIGMYGEKENVKKILNGTYQPPEGTSPSMRNLLEELKRPPQVNTNTTVSTELPTEKYISGWKNSKEKTSAGGQTNFSQHKALACLQETADFEATMYNIPYATGYSPSRYQYGTDAMLLKASKSRRIEKLRTIILYGAEFNFMNKILGRDMMANAESNNSLAPEQFGSRKSKSAIELAVCKRLTFDITRQKKHPAALCSNDAVSCYDRIIHAIASISMQRTGVPLEPIICMFSTIGNLTHNVRTAFGDSKGTYTGKIWIVPLQGVGQGNGAGPAIWAVVSTPVLNMLRKMGYGTVFKAAISGESIHFAGFAFVDDTDILQTTKMDSDDIYDVATYLQEAIEVWNGGISATGGALDPNKSYYSVFDFMWKNGRWSYTSMEDSDDINICMQDKNGDQVTLRRLSHTESLKTLGVFLAPDGNNDDEVKYLRALAEKYAVKLQKGYLSKQEVYMAFKQNISKSIQYPLPALTLTEAECTYVNAPIVQASLRNLRISSKYPRSLVYASDSFNGVGFFNIYNLLGAGHVEFLLRHYDSPSITGKLLRTSLQQLQLEMGLQNCVFTYSFSQFKNSVTPSWMSHLWKYVSETNISLIPPEDQPQLQKLRDNDFMIMDRVITMGWTSNEIACFNRCRLFVQCTTAADILTGDSKYIRKDIWTGKNITIHRQQEYEWPIQKRPGKSDWIIWRKCLGIIFNPTYDLQVQTDLGNWLGDLRWKYFYDITTKIVYRRIRTNWYMTYKQPHIRRRRFSSRFTATSLTDRLYQYQGTSPSIPHTARKCTVILKQSTIRLTGHGLTRDHISNTTKQHLELFCENKSVTINVDKRKIVESIKSGTAIAVSDGSYKDDIGTAAMILEAPTGERLTMSMCVPGPPKCHDAYRSELAGLLSILCIAELLVEQFAITDGSIEVGCDGQGALHRAFRDIGYATPAGKHFDLLLVIHAKLNKSPLKWKYRHVYGHQDELHKDHLSLDKWAVRNIEVDILAKLRREWCAQINYADPVILPGEGWKVHYKGTKIVSCVSKSLYKAIHDDIAKEYWQKKMRMSTTLIDSIDWKSQEKALLMKPRPYRHWVSKQATGMCGVGKWTKIYKTSDHDKCPRCSHPAEDVIHYLKCTSASATLVWHQSISQLSDWFETEEAPLELRDIIISYLNAWRFGYKLGKTQFSIYGFHLAAKDQNTLGWNNFLFGKLHISWVNCMDNYYKLKHKRRSGTVFIARMIVQVWNLSRNQWDDRNRCLHTIQEASEHQDGPDLAIKIANQLNHGHSDLPIFYQQFFSQPPEEIFDAPISYQREWLNFIQTARDHVNKAKPPSPWQLHTN